MSSSMCYARLTKNKFFLGGKNNIFSGKKLKTHTHNNEPSSLHPKGTQHTLLCSTTQHGQLTRDTPPEILGSKGSSGAAPPPLGGAATPKEGIMRPHNMERWRIGNRRKQQVGSWCGCKGGGQNHFLHPRFSKSSPITGFIEVHPPWM